MAQAGDNSTGVSEPCNCARLGLSGSVLPAGAHHSWLTVFSSIGQSRLFIRRTNADTVYESAVKMSNAEPHRYRGHVNRFIQQVSDVIALDGIEAWHVGGTHGW